MYEIHKKNINENAESLEESVDMNVAVASGRNVWSEDDTLSLISEYKAHGAKFKSSTIRNSAVWQQIAIKLKTHTAPQCENRFKYLKNQYIKKVESLGSKNTGGTFIKFPYFDQFDEMFRTHPNIHPIALASSSQPSTSTITEKKRELDEDYSSSDEVKRKMKKTNLQKHLENLEKLSESGEAARDQRHKENLKQRGEALQTLSAFCNNITEILKKNNLMRLSGTVMKYLC